MSEWFPYKASAKERTARLSKKTCRPRMCRICGKIVNNSGSICYSCNEYIKRMKARDEG